MFTQRFESAGLSEADARVLNVKLHNGLRSLNVHQLLAIFFPINHFLNREIGLGLLFFISAGGFGLWYLCHWFTAPRNAARLNDEFAMDALNEYIASGQKFTTASTTPVSG
ncbi:MAG: hypothetical protein EBV86_14970 [Marivivens sp.]|nr:hypothetical protein [Marivivens sp.]